MRRFLIISGLFITLSGCSQDRNLQDKKNIEPNKSEMKEIANGKDIPYNKLSEEEEYVIVNKSR